MTKFWGIVRFSVGAILALAEVFVAIKDVHQISSVNVWTTSRDGYIVGMVIGLAIMFGIAFWQMWGGLRMISRANVANDTRTS